MIQKGFITKVDMTENNVRQDEWKVLSHEVTSKLRSEYTKKLPAMAEVKMFRQKS